MPFIGNTPAESYISFAKQDITGNGGTSYSLNHPVTNAADIELFVNNVQQEPTTAYTASGSTLTLSEAIASTDDCYCIFRGRALQTTTPPDGSVTSAKLDTNIAVSGTLSTVGNVGIGASSSSTKLHISGNASNASALSDTVTDFALKFDSATTTNYFSNAICFAEGTNVNASIASFDGGSGGAQGLVFGTGASNTERMRIASVGLVTFNGDKNGVSDAQVNIVNDEANGLYRCLNLYTGVTSQRIVQTFHNGNGQVGYIATNGSATSYVTSSDYRLKTAVNYDWDATTRLKQLRPARFEWIADGDDAVPVDGFLAHEVQSVIPEAITGTKDEVEVWKDGEELPDGVSVGDNKLDENGDTIPVMQGIDQSKIVPLLVKTIIELEARITALEAS